MILVLLIKMYWKRTISDLECNIFDEAVTSMADTSPVIANYSIALLSLVSKHKVSDSCANDILKLISQILLSPNIPNPLLPTLFLLLKNFLRYDDEIITHHCCGTCGMLLQEGSQ